MNYLSAGIEAATQPGAEWGAKIRSAIAVLPAAGGRVILPGGALDISSEIVSTKHGVSIIGQGDASLGATAPTTLNWVGGASPVITVDSTRDWVLSNFNINNNGAATIGLNLISNASNIFNLLVDHVSIVNPVKKFSAYAFKVSGPGARVCTYVTFRKCFVALAAPVGLHVNHANVVYVEDTAIINNTLKNIEVAPSNIVVSFHMRGGSAEFNEGAGETATAIGVDLGEVYSSSINGSYFETQKTGQFAINVSAKTIGVQISDCFFNSPTTTTEYAINVINGYFPVSIHDNMLDNYLVAGIKSNAPTHLATYQNSAAGNTPMVIAGGERFP